jgi:ADP-heptose:LPS heptosyltransferase
VLFIELAEMGSTVLAYPAMQALKARYPGAQLYFVLFKHITDISCEFSRENEI